MSDRTGGMKFLKGENGQWRQEPKCADEVKLYMEGEEAGIVKGFKWDVLGKPSTEFYEPMFVDNGPLRIKSTPWLQQVPWPDFWPQWKIELPDPYAAHRRELEAAGVEVQAQVAEPARYVSPLDEDFWIPDAEPEGIVPRPGGRR